MRLHFKGRLLKLLTKDTRLPNGHRITLEIVEHPGAVVIVPFLDSNRIIFLRQFRPVVGRTLCELPAGTLNEGEGLLRCAKRELAEETGYKARRFLRLGKIFPVPGYSTETMTIFKAQGLSSPAVTSPQRRKAEGYPLKKDPDEILKVCTLSRAQIQSLFQRGLLHDAKTICALVFCGIL